MSEWKKSNLTAWIWLVAAMVVAIVGLFSESWVREALGLGYKHTWFFGYMAVVCGIAWLMIRVAKGYDEDDTPDEPIEEETPDAPDRGTKRTSLRRAVDLGDRSPDRALVLGRFCREPVDLRDA